MTENDRLSANQKKAIVALLQSTSIREAARTCGLGEATLYRYLNDDAFRDELHRRQDSAMAAAASALAGMMGDALAVLRDTLQDDEASDSVKVRAAQIIVDERRMIELVALARDIRELEDGHHGDG